MIEHHLSRTTWDHTIKITKAALDSDEETKNLIEMNIEAFRFMGKERLEGALIGIFLLHNHLSGVAHEDSARIARGFTGTIIYTLHLLGFDPFADERPPKPVEWKADRLLGTLMPPEQNPEASADVIDFDNLSQDEIDYEAYKIFKQTEEK